MDKRELSRELDLVGFSVVLDDEQPEWTLETWRELEEEYPVFPCRTIEVTEEIRAADARQRQEREVARRASLTWKSPVATAMAEGGPVLDGRNLLRGGAPVVSVGPKQPAVYLFPTNRMHGRRKEVA